LFLNVLLIYPLNRSLVVPNPPVDFEWCPHSSCQKSLAAFSLDCLRISWRANHLKRPRSSITAAPGLLGNGWRQDIGTLGHQDIGTSGHDSGVTIECQECVASYKSIWVSVAQTATETEVRSLLPPTRVPVLAYTRKN